MSYNRALMISQEGFADMLVCTVARKRCVMSENGESLKCGECRPCVTHSGRLSRSCWWTPIDRRGLKTERRNYPTRPPDDSCSRPDERNDHLVFILKTDAVVCLRPHGVYYSATFLFFPLQALGSKEIEVSPPKNLFW